jgi:hypothetical protein
VAGGHSVFGYVGQLIGGWRAFRVHHGNGVVKREI